MCNRSYSMCFQSMVQLQRVTSRNLNNKIKHLVRIIYGKRKFELIENFRIAAKIYNIEELHLYELLKLVI